MRLEDISAGVNQFLMRLADGKSTGYVGCAVIILRSAVKQEQRTGRKRTLSLGAGVVVDNGAVFGKSGDCGKTVGEEQFLFFPEGAKFVDNNFSESFSGFC